MEETDRKNQAKNIPGKKTRQLNVKEMKDSRWPKVSIFNKNDSRWGANFRKRWEEWGEPEITTKVMSWESDRTRDTMEKAIKKDIGYIRFGRFGRPYACVKSLWQRKRYSFLFTSRVGVAQCY